MKTYRVNELVTDMNSVRRSVSHFEWDDGFTLDDATNILTISTLEGKKLKFKVETGELVRERDPSTPGLLSVTFRFIVQLYPFSFFVI